MIGEFFSWYFGALVDFWGTALRLGLPQILLLILILMWLRRARCRKCGDESDGESGDGSCCWTWGGARGRWGWCCRTQCCCKRAQRCCNGGSACEMGAEADVEAGAEVEIEVVEDAEAAEEAEVSAEADDT